ncbi:MAG: hypothetical protein ABSE95_03980 [Thermodesulfobacteriota bacterium]|jgi:hypothetical protein
MKKNIGVLTLLIAILSLIAGPVLAAEKTLVIKLERVEVAGYWSFYLDPQERRGSPLILAFVYSIKNPSTVKWMLDEMKFSISFEDAEINSVTVYEDNTIPPRTTDFFRIIGSFDAFVVSGNPNVRDSKARKEKNIPPAELVKKWWEGIGDFNFPITVNGTATFIGPNKKSIIVPFEETFPPKK